MENNEEKRDALDQMEAQLCGVITHSLNEYEELTIYEVVGTLEMIKMRMAADFEKFCDAIDKVQNGGRNAL